MSPKVCTHIYTHIYVLIYIYIADAVGWSHLYLFSTHTLTHNMLKVETPIELESPTLIPNPSPQYTLPPEIFIEIINNIKYDSNQFLIDYLNIINAINPIEYPPIFNYLIENFNNHIDLINFDSTINTNNLSPLVSNINTFFNWVPFLSDFKKDKLILLINDDLINKFNNYQSFKENFQDQVFKFNINSYCTITYDIIYTPSLTEYFYNNKNNEKITNGYMFRKLYSNDGKLTSPNLMKFISFLPQNFKLDNLIFDFNHSKILLPTDLFGIYSSNFFIFHENFDIDAYHHSTSTKWLQPRCNQISFPGVTHLLLDYMAMDSFISNIIDKYGLSTSGSNYHSNNNSNTISPVQYLFNIFLKDVSFWLPNLIDLKFNNMNCPNATCNFIDLSTNVLTKLANNDCLLKSYFDLHSLSNWEMNSLYKFGGHRFKFDITTKSGSTEDANKKILNNIKFLAKLINNETNDGVTYLRVSLFPPNVKESKILNWLPLGSSETLQETSETGRTVSPTRTIIKQEPKPILCLKSSSLEFLELRVLAMDLNKNNHIQGLFLPNLKQLILQNFQFDINSPFEVKSKIQDNYNNTEMMFNDLNLYPTGFSSWNDLENCELINLIDNIQQSDQRSSHSIHLIFNINNLKQIMPRIKLKESFYTFVDERQQFIVV